MSDTDSPDGGDLPPRAAQQRPDDPSPRSPQAAISEILSDPSLSVDDKRERLEGLRRDTADAPEDPDADAYAPLEDQIMHAFALLAEGGHSYGPGRVEGDDDLDDDLEPDLAPGVPPR